MGSSLSSTHKTTLSGDLAHNWRVHCTRESQSGVLCAMGYSLNAPIVETSFTEIAISLLDFSPWIPLGTFSMLLNTREKTKWRYKVVVCHRRWVPHLMQYIREDQSCHLANTTVSSLRSIHKRWPMVSRCIFTHNVNTQDWSKLATCHMPWVHSLVQYVKDVKIGHLSLAVD